MVRSEPLVRNEQVEISELSSRVPVVTARCISVLGTASDVGKSTVATALCRVLSDRGVRVAPYKAQNMSNNSAVTIAGGEIGRAQFVQACAARVEAHVDMNPVLLKPTSDQAAQIVLLGQVLGTQTAAEYFRGGGKPIGEVALSALERLLRRYDVVVAEGAGSCAEVNLRDRDFVNFRPAHAADASVLLVADIDRGGVFAQVVGTLEVLEAAERARIKGVLINRFRGDRSLFDDGVRFLERRTGVPVVGVLPFRYDLRLEAEDGLNLQTVIDPSPAVGSEARLRIGVIRLPHISNFTDFDALSSIDGVALHYLTRPRAHHDYDLYVLPGSKAVRADLQWLRAQGFDAVLSEHVARGRALLGICGGYQMLGHRVSDPLGVEGSPGESTGLGLLEIQTELLPHKVVRRVRGYCELWQAAINGYEIHMGQTQSKLPSLTALEPPGDSSSAAPLRDGALHGRVLGSYVHGLLDEPAALRGLLRWLDPDGDWEGLLGRPSRDAAIAELAEHFCRHVNVDAVLSWIG